MRKIEEDAREISELLRQEKDPKVKLKLCALNLITTFKMPVRDVSCAIGVPLRTIYDWIRNWQKGKYNGLKDKPILGGRPPRLGREDLERLKEYLKEKPFWTTKQVRYLIKERFNIDLSENQVRRILKEKFKMNFSKPYPKDYRRPKEAEEILASNLETVMRLLKEKGLKEEDVAAGFLDEASPQLTANTVRVWSFGKPEIVKNTERIRSNTIGFYAIRGESLSGFLERSRAPNIAKFLEKIKEQNRGYKAIIVVLDNFPSHRANVVKKRAEELGIYLVYLPSYSPDLNPIECLWRSIKRVISLKLIKTIEELKATIKESFQRFSTKLTYAKEWIRIFMRGSNLCENLCN
jgi:transposase